MMFVLERFNSAAALPERTWGVLYGLAEPNQDQLRECVNQCEGIESLVKKNSRVSLLFWMK